MEKKKLKEDFLIQVEGRMEDAHAPSGSAEPESLQLMTRGNYVLRNHSYFITYAESETTGYAGSTTTVKVAVDGHQVSMIRYGQANAHLIIEKGVRHLCHYDTGVGAMTLGVAADEISHDLGPTGGTVHFSYTLDMDPMGQLSRNYVTIRVSPASPAAAPVQDNK